MQAKMFMEQVRRAGEELKLIAKKREHFQEMATSIGVKLTDMPSSGQKGASRVEAGAIGLVDLLADLDAKEAEYCALVRKAEALIAKLPQENFRKILTLNYIVCCSQKTLQDEMRFKDKKSVYRCNKYALRELQKIM